MGKNWGFLSFKKNQYNFLLEVTTAYWGFGVKSGRKWVFKVYNALDFSDFFYFFIFFHEITTT